ncbi:MAG: CPBP family intramembrane metalloprotease [Candidatus Amulumruptor sp.]
MAEMKMKFSQRVLMFIFISMIGLLVAAVLSSIVLMSGQTATTLRIATIINDLIMFVIPPVICALLYTSRPAEYLHVDAMPRMTPMVLAVGTMICSIPMMNMIIEWNEGLTLPSSLASIETWMREAEERAGDTINVLMGGDSVSSLIMSILIVGVLAGFSEELFFRGGIQRLLVSGRINPHVAIWLTAFIFSAIHLQFFGFFPRLLLGTFFGYLLYWTKNLWVPITCHILNNTIVATVTWTTAKGTSTSSTLNDIGTLSSSHPLRWVTLSIITTFLLLMTLKQKSLVKTFCH